MIADGRPPQPAQNLLLFDVGNSSTKIGTWQNDDIRTTTTIPHGKPDELRSIIAEYWQALDGTRQIVGCAVAPDHLADLRRAIAESIVAEIMVVGSELAVPLDVAIEDPSGVGTDRLCAAAAAYFIEGRPCTVVDLGTAITIDCVDADGSFIGGAILPGMAMQAAGLASDTAQLPLVSLERPAGPFGQSSRQAILSGIYHGTIGAIRGIVEAYASKLGCWPVLLLTGGDAPFIAEDLEIADKVVPHLCLRGVVLAYQRSFPQTEP